MTAKSNAAGFPNFHLQDISWSCVTFLKPITTPYLHLNYNYIAGSLLKDTNQIYKRLNLTLIRANSRAI